MRLSSCIRCSRLGYGCGCRLHPNSRFACRRSLFSNVHSFIIFPKQLFVASVHFTVTHIYAVSGVPKGALRTRSAEQAPLRGGLVTCRVLFARASGLGLWFTDLTMADSCIRCGRLGVWVWLQIGSELAVCWSFTHIVT